MSNPLYNSMQQPSMASMLQNLKKDPIGFLMKSKFNIPNNISNDPNAIIQHLMRTGQVSQQQYNKAMQMAQQFK